MGHPYHNLQTTLWIHSTVALPTGAVGLISELDGVGAGVGDGAGAGVGLGWMDKVNAGRQT
jgi:hypothetical protein